MHRTHHAQTATGARPLGFLPRRRAAAGDADADGGDDAAADDDDAADDEGDDAAMLTVAVVEGGRDRVRTAKAMVWLRQQQQWGRERGDGDEIDVDGEDDADEGDETDDGGDDDADDSEDAGDANVHESAGDAHGSASPPRDEDVQPRQLQQPRQQQPRADDAAALRTQHVDDAQPLPQQPNEAAVAVVTHVDVYAVTVHSASTVPAVVVNDVGDDDARHDDDDVAKRPDDVTQLQLQPLRRPLRRQRDGDEDDVDGQLRTYVRAGRDADDGLRRQRRRGRGASVDARARGDWQLTGRGVHADAGDEDVRAVVKRMRRRIAAVAVGKRRAAMVAVLWLWRLLWTWRDCCCCCC